MSMSKDWTGNSRSTHAMLGARNYALEDRAEHDYYATEPKATKLLLEVENFSPVILEPACGGGHIAEVLKEFGYEVIAQDLFDHGYGDTGIDFFSVETWNFDIITNPPYKLAREFVEHSLDIISDGCKVAMFLKVQFLEGKARKELFKKYPPKYVYVSSSRLRCAANGDFEKYAKSNAVAYAWYVWEKGSTTEPVIRWIN